MHLTPYLKHALCWVTGLTTPLMATTVADFEDVNLPKTYGGPGGGHYYNGVESATSFTSRGAQFPNEFTDFGTFESWNGFAVSSTTDNTTAGFGNQYSAFTGAAFSGSQYAVAFASPDPVISFPNRLDLAAGGGFYVTNTTYAALAMSNGDSFSKRFGGTSGNDPDFFRLTVEGLVGGNPVSPVVEFFLADYRFADNSQDYIVDEWTWVDLSSLGEVDGLRFSLDSTDNGSFGMNTPAYFAVDNMTVPEPGTSALLVAALGGWTMIRRRS